MDLEHILSKASERVGGIKGVSANILVLGGAVVTAYLTNQGMLDTLKFCFPHSPEYIKQFVDYSSYIVGGLAGLRVCSEAYCQYQESNKASQSQSQNPVSPSTN